MQAATLEKHLFKSWALQGGCFISLSEASHLPSLRVFTAQRLYLQQFSLAAPFCKLPDAGDSCRLWCFRVLLLFGSTETFFWCSWHSVLVNESVSINFANMSLTSSTRSAGQWLPGTGVSEARTSNVINSQPKSLYLDLSNCDYEDSWSTRHPSLLLKSSWAGHLFRTGRALTTLYVPLPLILTTEGMLKIVMVKHFAA